MISNSIPLFESLSFDVNCSMVFTGSLFILEMITPSFNPNDFNFPAVMVLIFTP